MTTKEKFNNRKYARLFGILAYVLLGIFFANIAGLIIWRNSTDVIVTNGFYMALIALMIIVPIMTGLILTVLSQMFSAKLFSYKSRIKEYRIRKYFSLALKCIYADDFEGAKYYYNGFIPANRDERTYLYGLMIYIAIKSGEPERKEKAQKILDDLLEYYNPDNFKF